jgi:hypothetical protein
MEILPLSAAQERKKSSKFSSKPAFLIGFCSEAVQRAVDTRRATENPGGVLDSTSRSLRERNTVDMVLCDAAVETL